MDKGCLLIIAALLLLFYIVSLNNQILNLIIGIIFLVGYLLYGGKRSDYDKGGDY